MKKNIILFLILLLLSPSVVAKRRNAPIVKAKVNKTSLKTGEVFIYTLTIEGNFSSSRIELPDFKNFIIVSQFQSQQQNIKGSQIIMKYVLTLHLMAKRPGKFTIKEAKIKDKNKVLKSNKITIVVRGKPLEKKSPPPIFEGEGIDI